ncbi:MAG: hypothetical protein LBI49_19540 [Nocardiopsaceae bacterium]|jgi:hypothetical protein|nr:hypothetical protein [Nocardiopsaceae bacterium]
MALALLLFAVVAAAHAAGTEVVQHLGRVTSTGEIFFPAAGLTVVALLLLPRRLWPLVLVGVFGSELLGGALSRGGAMAAVGPALAHTLEPAVGMGVLVTLGG